MKFKLSRQFAPRNVPFRGDPGFNFTSSGQVNCPCGKVRAMRPGRLDAPDGAARLRTQENWPETLSTPGQSSRAKEEIFFSMAPFLPMMMPLWLAFSQ